MSSWWSATQNAFGRRSAVASAPSARSPGVATISFASQTRASSRAATRQRPSWRPEKLRRAVWSTDPIAVPPTATCVAAVAFEKSARRVLGQTPLQLRGRALGGGGDQAHPARLRPAEVLEEGRHRTRHPRLGPRQRGVDDRLQRAALADADDALAREHDERAAVGPQVLRRELVGRRGRRLGVGGEGVGRRRPAADGGGADGEGAARRRLLGDREDGAAERERRRERGVLAFRRLRERLGWGAR